MEEYWFFCRRWLAKDEDDHQIVRELIACNADGKPLGDLQGITFSFLLQFYSLRFSPGHLCEINSYLLFPLSLGFAGIITSNINIFKCDFQLF